MRQLSTAVLIHGCHLQADGWEEIVWGRPRQGVLGRVPKGLVEAAKWDARLIVFSTGASEKDGLKEGEYTYRYALEHLTEVETLLLGVDNAKRWLSDRTGLELTSQNTREEIRASAFMALEDHIERLVLVTSPSHVMRAHQEALSVLGAEPQLRHYLDNLYAAASHTCFANSTVEDVVIFEPPHRGDRPKHELHKHIRATRSVPAAHMPEFIPELLALVEAHGGRKA